MRKSFHLLVGVLLAQQLAAQDLVIEQVNLYTSEVVQESYIYPFTWVKNNGSAPAENYKVSYLLSKDSLLDAGDKLLDLKGPYSTAAGRVDSSQAVIEITEQTEEGRYYLIAVADPENVVAESNEGNNAAKFSLTIVKRQLDLSLGFPYGNKFKAGKGSSIVPVAGIYTTGNSFADSLIVNYYLSADTSAGPEDRLLKTSIYEFYSYPSIFDRPELVIPEETAAGDYYLIAVVDEKNKVKETNERNNTIRGYLKVEEPYHNLAISALTTAKNSSLEERFPGGTFTTYTRIRNTGNVAASGIKVNHYISADSILSDDDKFYAVTEHALLQPGDSAFIYAAYNIPYDANTGRYYIISQIAHNPSFPDAVASDNSKSLVLDIANRNADLALKNLTVEGARTAAGSMIFPRAELHSYGNYILSTANHFYLSEDTVYGNGDVLLNAEYTDVYPGYIQTVNPVLHLDASLKNGNYTLFAVTDAENSTKETDETNNIARAAVTIEDRNTDLTISYARDTVLVTKPGVEFYLPLLEKNLGTTYAGGHSVGFYLSKDTILDQGDAALISNSYSAGVAGNGTVNVYGYGFIYFNARPGEYYLIAQADNNQAIQETNEQNNTDYVKVTILPVFVDFAVKAFSESDTALAGNGFIASAEVFNNGRDTAESTSVTFYLSADTLHDSTDTHLGSINVSDILPGSTVKDRTYLSVPENQPAGRYFLISVVDESDFTGETDETNNTHVSELDIRKGKADLTSEILSVFADSVQPGDYLYGYLSIFNMGNISARTFYTGFYLSKDSVPDASDIFTDRRIRYGIGAGGMDNFEFGVNIPSDVKPGIYYLIAYADDTDTLEEFNETNNYAHRRIQIGKVNDSDLKIYIVGELPVTFKQGEAVTVESEVSNFGKATGDLHVNFFFSADQFLDPSDTYLTSTYVSGIAEDGNVRISSAVGVPGRLTGEYYLLAVADYGNKIHESDETNNVWAAKVYIADEYAKPELAIIEAGSEKTDLSAGENVVVFATKANLNAVPSGFHATGIYFSADSLLSQDDLLMGATSVYPEPGYFQHTYSFSVNIPTEISTGIYYLIAVADNENTIPEWDEENNKFAFAINVTGDVLTGLSGETTAEQLSVYPNPTEGRLNITFMQNADEVEVTTASGTVIISEKVSSLSITSLDLSGYGAGLYYVRLKKEGIVTAAKRIAVRK